MLQGLPLGNHETDQLLFSKNSSKSMFSRAAARAGLKTTIIEKPIKDILNIQDINIINVGKDLKSLVFTFQNGVENSIEELSDGTLIALNIITYFISNKYPVIAIEEFENSLHPKLITKMIHLIRNDFHHVQVILTTHSPIVLSMVKINEISVVSNKEFGEAIIEQVKNKKELTKKLSGSFSDFSDMLLYE